MKNKSFSEKTCEGCVYFYSDDGPFDPYVWGPWCHCLDSECPPPRADKR